MFSFRMILLVTAFPCLVTAFPCLVAGSVLAGKSPADDLSPEQQAFWQQLQSLCGRAFPGRLSDATDFYRQAIEGRQLIAHGVSCDKERIHVALHVDENTFHYGVHWPKYGHSIRLSFNLARPLVPPPLPWGFEKAL